MGEEGEGEGEAGTAVERAGQAVGSEGAGGESDEDGSHRGIEDTSRSRLSCAGLGPAPGCGADAAGFWSSQAWRAEESTGHAEVAASAAGAGFENGHMVARGGREGDSHLDTSDTSETLSFGVIGRPSSRSLLPFSRLFSILGDFFFDKDEG